jgi:hypothetical protein
MRSTYHLASTIAIVVLTAGVGMSQETSRAVAGGGISVPGWTGKIDAGEERAGQALNNAKLAQEGGALQYHSTR